MWVKCPDHLFLKEATMQNDVFVDGEALSGGGIDVTPIVGSRQTGLSPKLTQCSGKSKPARFDNTSARMRPTRPRRRFIRRPHW